MNLTAISAPRFWLALALGLFAGLADYLGGFLLVLPFAFRPRAALLRRAGRRFYALRRSAGDAARGIQA